MGFYVVSAVQSSRLLLQAPSTPVTTTSTIVKKNADLLCNIPYPELGHCAESISGITNPSELFKMECSAYGSCAASTFNFEYGPTSTAQTIQAMIFSDYYS